MKRVLLIAEMNEVTKSMNEALLPYFQVQLCLPDGSFAGRLLRVFEPDVILVLLSRISEMDMKTIRMLLKENRSLNAIIVGNAYEMKAYDWIDECVNAQKILRPVSNQKIIQVLCGITGVDYSDYEKKVLGKEERRKHILFVDDNPLLLRTMKALISDKYKVSIAVSGAQAMEILQKDCPDMIFLDYEMPLINGKMVLRVIRSNQRYEKLPVVILSAVSDREYIEELLKLKPDGYLLKPARQDQILEMIDKCLG